MGVRMTSRYAGKQTVTSVHEPSQCEITTTAPVDVGGTGRYFSPTDLLACSLGCCALTTMSKVADKMGYSFEGSSVEVEKHIVDKPRRVGKLSAGFTLASEYSDEQRKALEEAAYTCPVALTLKGNVELDFRFSYTALESG
jgi:putative redox protein